MYFISKTIYQGWLVVDNNEKGNKKSAKKIVSFFHETTFNSQVMLMVEMYCIMFGSKHEKKTWFLSTA